MYHTGSILGRFGNVSQLNKSWHKIRLWPFWVKISTSLFSLLAWIRFGTYLYHVDPIGNWIGPFGARPYRVNSFPPKQVCALIPQRDRAWYLLVSSLMYDVCLFYLRHLSQAVLNWRNNFKCHSNIQYHHWCKFDPFFHHPQVSGKTGNVNFLRFRAGRSSVVGWMERTAWGPIRKRWNA